LIHFVPRDNIAQQAEIRKKTVIEYDTKAAMADQYRELAKKLENNEKFTIPTPMTQEKPEEILMEFGLMNNIEDDYKI